MRIHSRPLVRAARDVQWTRAKKGKETKGKETKAQPESEGDELDLEATRAEMETVIGTATKELSGLRIGRADPALVEHVYVNGEPLRSLAQLHVRDATALVVTAYDASQTAELVAAIQRSQGPFPLNAQLDGRSIVVPVPK
jgi:ribosome recycling factor